MPSSIRLFVFFILCTSVFTASSSPSESHKIAEDTPWQTFTGHPFTAPKDWTVTNKGNTTLIEAPEGGSYVALIDVEAKTSDEALALAWKAIGGTERRIELVTEQSDADGWTKRKRYQYVTSPNEKRSVSAGTMFANNTWTVWVYNMAHSIGGKRGAQVRLVFSSLRPKGYEKESFAGKKPHFLKAEKLAELKAYIKLAMQTTGVPSGGLGIIQNGKVVFADGFGVKDFRQREKADADTLFMVASNTKAMTTLLLAKLVDEGKIAWDTPIVDIYPEFRLGDDETTKRVLVEHLICACTGLPRKDYEWLLEYKDLTPEGVIKGIAETQPTTDFGEMFQYSNPLAAAAGFIGGRVVYSDLSLGNAYDKAMQTKVFDPLGMSSTTFDFDKALRGNHAEAFGPNIHGEVRQMDMGLNRTVVPVRPAGAAWSSVNDMLKYVAFELAEGKLANGKQYISAASVTERHKEKVALGESVVYGMGLIVSNEYDIEVVHHGGDMFGHHSDMIWIPEHEIGAVILTSGDPGWLIRSGFQRKLLEVLFDGNPEADESIKVLSKNFYEQQKTYAKKLDMPANPEVTSKLADSYQNDKLGKIDLVRKGKDLIFDFGEWSSQVTTMKNEDGSFSIVTIAPGAIGFEFVVEEGESPSLITRDSQHEYIFKGL